MTSVRVEPLASDIRLIISEELSPEAVSRAMAGYARERRAEAIEVNRQIFGTVPRVRTYVDGRELADLESVRPDGRIVVEFDLMVAVARWIANQLSAHSPRRSGRYARSHLIFADGAEVTVERIPPLARELVFVPSVIYARLIEPRGSRPALSRQAPNGVYQAVAALARARFGLIGRIQYTFREVTGVDESRRESRGRRNRPRDARMPAIVFTVAG